MAALPDPTTATEKQDDMTETLAILDKTINDLRADNAKKGAIIAQQGAIITQQGAIITQQGELITQKDAIIAEKDAVITQKDAIIAQKDAEKDRAEATVYEVRTQAAVNEHLLHAAQADLDSTRAQLSALRSHLGSPPSYSSDVGTQYLAALYCTYPADPRYDVPMLVWPGHSRARLVSYLGRGATAAGYSCIEPPASYSAASGGSTRTAAAPGGRYIAKVFTNADARELADVEKGILLALADAPQHHAIPATVTRLTLVGEARTNASQPVLLLAPIGIQRFAMPIAGQPLRAGSEPANTSTFCKLVWALLDFHVRGWCHRDPRPENFFITCDGNFLLADVGSATPIGEAYANDGLRAQSHLYGPWEALVYGEAWLESLRGGPAPVPLCFFPRHDYEIVARMVYAAGRRLQIPPSNEPGVVKAAWARHARAAGLLLLLEKARKLGEAVERDRSLTQEATIDAVEAFLGAIQAELPLESSYDGTALQEEQARVVADAKAAISAHALAAGSGGDGGDAAAAAFAGGHAAEGGVAVGADLDELM